MDNGLRETFKTFLRGVYFAVLGMLGTFLASLATDQNLLDTVVTIGDVYLQVGVVLSAVVAALAKMIDRFIHKNDNINLNGITPVDLLDR
jgi:hypothetical protein